ncbi:MAG: hypothetical protein ACYDBJ_14675 [Aggregatilineales bacterium]
MTPFDQLRIDQLLSSYGPDNPPSLPLEFGDYLSLLWRQDHAGNERRAHYYRRCAQSLAVALGLADREIGRLVRVTPAGGIYAALENVPYRVIDRTVDAADRRAAIRQLLQLRGEVLQIGVYDQGWDGTWPGSGIVDTDLRDRVFAVLFAALPGQFPSFARLLLVIDIVLQELLTGARRGPSILLYALLREYGYPDPASSEMKALYANEAR